ncbi:GGDEF domain-containing protein [Actinoplanes flavus]|uniref:GGDEF domain-containing protein n=1 Tax=Actinoplanes flavus TaxID=2820290 RepID=A0ABS3UXW2_9ACTN|nr:GGDEF domain-containing protein [Actinoplanes flavus]MBO3743414.1 GGDEF domain-containing protein [Actinoplanes flavus]
MGTRSAGRTVIVGFAALAAFLALGYLTGDGRFRVCLLLLSGILAAVAVAAGLRWHRVADQRPWVLVIIALLLLTATNAAWLVAGLSPGDGVPPALLTVPLQLGGYLFLLAASLVVVLRHAPRDASGTIDAAVWGIAVAAPVWEFLFRPRVLDASAGVTGQLIALTQLLVLLGICGALLRVSQISDFGKSGLRLLFGALVCTIAGVGAVHMLGTAGERSPLPAFFFALGYLALGAAGLHPSIKQFTEPVVDLSPPAPRMRLGRLGAALLLIPLAGGVGQLAGQPADGLLLTIAPLLSIPLVLIRIDRLKHVLVHQATHDELTGLLNRRHLFTVMAEAITAHAAGAPGHLALIYCDLNGFKAVNDEYGHEAGDAILRATARRITGAVRPGDAVARIGGDEFLIFCSGADDTTAGTLGARVAGAVAEPLPWNEHVLRVSAAVGAVSWTERRPVTPDELLAVADARMYADKRGSARLRAA